MDGALRTRTLTEAMQQKSQMKTIVGLCNDKGDPVSCLSLSADRTHLTSLGFQFSACLLPLT